MGGGRQKKVMRRGLGREGGGGYIINKRICSGYNQSIHISLIRIYTLENQKNIAQNIFSMAGPEGEGGSASR